MMVILAAYVVDPVCFFIPNLVIVACSVYLNNLISSELIWRVHFFKFKNKIYRTWFSLCQNGNSAQDCALQIQWDAQGYTW